MFLYKLLLVFCRRRRPRLELPNGCPRHMCMMYCEFGFQTNPETGCPVCRCNRPPVSLSDIPSHCSGRMCRLGCRYGFQTGEDGCPICRCNPPPMKSDIPSHCSGVMCRLGCRYGFQTGEDGCPICRCNPSPLRRADVEAVSAVGRDSLTQPRFTHAESGDDGW